MRYVNLGKSGLKVSRICLGCMSYAVKNATWRLDEAQSRPLIRRALELGINFFDVANMYSKGESETVLGRALGDFAKREDAPRFQDQAMHESAHPQSLRTEVSPIPGLNVFVGSRLR